MATVRSTCGHVVAEPTCGTAHGHAKHAVSSNTPQRVKYQLLLRLPHGQLARLEQRDDYRWWVVATVCIGAFLGQLDASIASLALRFVIECDYFTDAIDYTQVKILQEFDRQGVRFDGKTTKAPDAMHKIWAAAKEGGWFAPSFSYEYGGQQFRTCLQRFDDACARRQWISDANCERERRHQVPADLGR